VPCVLACDLVAGGRNREPGGAERGQALAIDVTRLLVLDEQVQRVPVVGNLPRPVRPPNGADESGVRAAGAAGVAPVRSDGHAIAHAPEHALLVPESRLNRYSVRPVESTRIRPRRLFATRTVAVLVGVVFDAGGTAAVAPPPPPPQAATARAVSGITAALARTVIGRLRVMSLLRVGRSTVAAPGGYRITRRVVRDRATS
jgi:hypothetical protein